MKVSVIIPTYNRVATVGRAIESVLAQSALQSIDDFELIVIDDGSTDGTQQMVNSRYPQCQLYSQSNLGVSAARNLGIQHAKGDWLAFLDSDDAWLPNKLQLQIDKIGESNLLFCHTHEIWMRKGVRVNQMKKHRKAGGWIFPQCLPLCAISPSSVLCHKSILENVGVFDETLPACEDYDLWLRVTSAYEVAFVDEPCLVKYGGHADQLSRQHWGMDRFRVRALEKILTTGLAANDYALALETLLAKLKILHAGAVKHGNQELRGSCQKMLAQWSPEGAACAEVAK